MMIITDNKTLKMLSDYLREILVSAVSLSGVCDACGADISAEVKSKFMDGWVRRFRKGLREGGAAGLAYRRERRIACPGCGRGNKSEIPSDAMSEIMDLIKNADPLFLRAKAEKRMAELPAARRKQSAAANEVDAVMAQKPYFCISRPSESAFDIVAGWFSKSRKAKRREKIAAQMQKYKSARAAHDARKLKWTETYAVAQEKEWQCASELSAVQHDIYAICETHGILPLLFPSFVRRCEIAAGRLIAAPSAEESPRQTSVNTRKRGAVGASIGPGGIRPWVRVGGVGMSFGKSGVGLFARKGPFAIYAKNGKVRIGGRFLRF